MSNRRSGLVGLFLVSLAAFTFAQASPVSEFEGVVLEADYQTRMRLTRTIADGDLVLELSALTSTAQMECDFGDGEASCDTDFGAQAELNLEPGSLLFELDDQVLEFQKRSGDPNRWPGVYRIPDYDDTEIPEVVIPDDPADEQAILTTEDGREVRLRLVWSGTPLAVITHDPHGQSERELLAPAPATGNGST